MYYVTAKKLQEFIVCEFDYIRLHRDNIVINRKMRFNLQEWVQKLREVFLLLYGMSRVRNDMHGIRTMPPVDWTLVNLPTPRHERKANIRSCTCDIVEKKQTDQ